MDVLWKIAQNIGFNVDAPLGAIVVLGLIAAAIGSMLGGTAQLALLPLGLAPLIYTMLRPFWLPRARRGRFGIVFAVVCENDAERKRVWADFGFRFCELARSGAVGRDIVLVRLSPYWSERVLNTPDAKSALVKMRARYLLSCRVRRRTIHGSEAWFLDLRGMVVHRPLGIHDKDTLQREFSELLPPSVKVDVEEDLLQFELEATRAEIVSRYILGIATYLSGDLVRAEKLYGDVKEQLHACTPWDGGERIGQRLPMRFAELAIARAGRAHSQWLTSPSDSAAAEMKRQLDTVPMLAQTREDYIALRSLQLVITDGDVQTARALYQSSCRKGTHSWRLGYAFLCASSGDWRTAAKNYREAGRTVTGVDPRILLQVEEFLFWFQQQPGGSAIASYCLGCLNMCVKHDNDGSVIEFERFLANTEAERVPAVKRRVSAWVSDTKACMAKADHLGG